MKRFLMDGLREWKDSHHRKPLILNGARQVGKTWLAKEFGRCYFESVAYINFDNNTALSSQFDHDYDLDRLLFAMQTQSQQEIIPSETLLIMDEIQECPKALTSLKYFAEAMPELAIIAAGSLLGLTMHTGTGYPVGKVTEMNLYPLNFREFLLAVGEEGLLEIVASTDVSLLSSFANRFIDRLKQYYFVGGMPEAVLSFSEDRDLSHVRNIQDMILLGYERDMSKHLTIRETESALSLWRSIPRHLGQENKRLIFGHIHEGARARDYREAITWLTKAGLAYRVPRIAKPSVPLSSYVEDNIFKLFALDVGLLGALADLGIESVLEKDDIFAEFKGALTEQYVCQELISDCGYTPYYWSASNSRGEIDFIVQSSRNVHPIEVKAAENLRSKSLRAFKEKHPKMHCRRFSLSGYRKEDWMENIPLYAIGNKQLWD